MSTYDIIQDLYFPFTAGQSVDIWYLPTELSRKPRKSALTFVIAEDTQANEAQILHSIATDNGWWSAEFCAQGEEPFYNGRRM